LAAAENGCAMMIERFALQAIEAGRPIKLVGPPVATGQSHYYIQRKTGPTEKRISSAFCDWLETCF
jgi:LysR family glycine cleavage system transcriptional activator